MAAGKHAINANRMYMHSISAAANCMHLCKKDVNRNDGQMYPPPQVQTTGKISKTEGSFMKFKKQKRVHYFHLTNND